MAVKLGGGRAARGYAARRKYSPMAEINVTPMVDVMLVLLVIFMVTAPLLTVGVPVDLPKTKAAAMNNDDKPLVVSVRKDGTIYLQDTEIDMDSLGPRLAAIIGSKPDTTVYVRADKDINYGVFAEVLAELQSNGITKIGLVNDAKDSGTPAAKPAGDAGQQPKTK
ncbi:MAG TPA: protein TolR [Dongiaceae bacterium]|jgi:biopolymer transport protein TolR|nr:protein TolR [Dongiaceae bacterium]